MSNNSDFPGPSATPQPSVSTAQQWISVHDRMPEPGTDCFVWIAQCRYTKEPFATVDTWEMQREAPLSFSSATIETGLGWNDHEFEEVSHWMQIVAPDAATPQPPAPTPAVDRGLSKAKWLRCEFCQQLGCANPLAPTASPVAPTQAERDAEAELNCAEEVLDAYAAKLPLERTGFDCLGDYVKAVVDAVESPASTWLAWVAADGYRTDAERAAARKLLSISPFRAAPTQAEPVAAGGVPSAEALARRFHDTYESLAPQFGYETRQDTKQFDPTSPNGQLMIAVCAEISAKPAPASEAPAQAGTLTAAKVRP